MMRCVNLGEVNVFCALCTNVFRCIHVSSDFPDSRRAGGQYLAIMPRIRLEGLST
jgi:hypothetical protein